MSSTQEDLGGCLHFGNVCLYLVLQSCYSTGVRDWNSVDFCVTGVRERDDVLLGVENVQFCSFLVFLISLWPKWVERQPNKLGCI